MSKGSIANISNHIYPGHVIAFKWAARESKCAIMVRRTNPASLPYIGKQGYTPKPVTCKPKTADKNTAWGYQIAGLVINPYLHKASAYKSISKFRDALGIWNKVKGELLGSLNYKVDEDKTSKHYGCLMYRDGSKFSYIHGDYDLYDVVDMYRPASNEAFLGRLDGAPNNYGPEFDRVRDLLNSKFSSVCGRVTNMIQHGSEAKYAMLRKDAKSRLDIFGDEPIDIFWPAILNASGILESTRVSVANGKHELRNLYKNEFEGRGFGRTKVKVLSGGK